MGSCRPGGGAELEIHLLRCNHLPAPGSTLERYGELAGFFHHNILKAIGDEQVSDPFTGEVILMAPGKTGTDPVDEMVDHIDDVVVVQADVDHLLLHFSQIDVFFIARVNTGYDNNKGDDTQQEGGKPHDDSFQRDPPRSAKSAREGATRHEKGRPGSVRIARIMATVKEAIGAQMPLSTSAPQTPAWRFSCFAQESLRGTILARCGDPELDNF